MKLVEENLNLEFPITTVKIFVSIPVEYVSKVRDAVCKLGAGVIGNYSYCTYSVLGVGTFVPGKNTNPFIGNENKLEFVKEEKLEFVCKVNNVKNVVMAIREAHPYEEPEIDIFPLIDENFFK